MPNEVIGLGRMGRNIVIVRRLIAHGHDAVIYDRDNKAVATRSGDGAVGAAGLEELVHRLGPPRTVWLMLPAGAFNARFRSRRERTFAEKVLSAMRKGFGGHVEPGTARP
jgi:6-phosphogluconate dehydrogenase (decarboxylating)